MFKTFVLAAVASICHARGYLLKNLPLSTSGTEIVDTKGNAVRLACNNWYGAHLERYVVNGLDEVNIDTLSELMVDQGFNCVRLPFSLEMYYSNPVVSHSAVSANSHLYGKTALEVFDATINSLTKAGLAVILNNHISDAIWCCDNDDSNGLWHNKNYSAQ
jgi:endoglucanase